MNTSDTSGQTPWLSIARKTSQILLILVLSIVIGLVDYLTGPNFTFSLFYLIPPSLAAWKMSRRLALFASLINSITWLWVDFSSGRFPPTLPVYAWNFSSRLISLLVVVILISSLRKSMDLEKIMSRVDSLTIALNSRAFKEALDLEIKRSQRYLHPLTLVYLDIDNFKSVNDLFGHGEGDNVLATIGNVIRSSIRQNDVLGRMGGDEFAILLVETDSVAAYSTVTKFQGSLMHIIQQNDWPISLSIGVLTCSEMFCKPEEMISLADQLMYSVKKNTKNNAKFASFSDIEEKKLR